jgi:hypothetical protein
LLAGHEEKRGEQSDARELTQLEDLPTFPNHKANSERWYQQTKNPQAQLRTIKPASADDLPMVTWASRLR